MELYDLTVHELRDKIAKGEITSKQIVDSYKGRIEEQEKNINAFVNLTLEEARK